MAGLAIIGGGFERPVPYNGTDNPGPRIVRDGAGTRAEIAPPQPIGRVPATGPRPQRAAPQENREDSASTRPNQGTRPGRGRLPTLVARPAAAAAGEATVTRFLAQRLAQETAAQGLYIDPHPRGLAAYHARTAPEPVPSVDLAV